MLKPKSIAWRSASTKPSDDELSDFQRTNLYGFDSTKAVAFSPTNPYLAATNIRGWITVWNSTTNRQEATLHHPRRRASRDDLKFSADGTHLASSNADTIQVWNLTEASEKTVMMGHEGGLPCAVFHPAGDVLATGGKMTWCVFGIRKPESSSVRFHWVKRFRHWHFRATEVCWQWGPWVRLTRSISELLTLLPIRLCMKPSLKWGHVHSLTWKNSPGERYLAGCGAGGVALWKVSTESPFAIEEVFAIDRNWCLATLLSKDVQLIVWVEEDSHLKAWNIAREGTSPARLAYAARLAWPGIPARRRIHHLCF